MKTREIKSNSCQKMMNCGRSVSLRLLRNSKLSTCSTRSFVSIHPPLLDFKNARSKQTRRINQKEIEEEMERAQQEAEEEAIGLPKQKTRTPRGGRPQEEIEDFDDEELLDMDSLPPLTKEELQDLIEDNEAEMTPEERRRRSLDAFARVKDRMVSLPPELRDRIMALFTGVSRQSLREIASDLSEKFRVRTGISTILRNEAMASSSSLSNNNTSQASAYSSLQSQKRGGSNHNINNRSKRGGSPSGSTNLDDIRPPIVYGPKETLAYVAHRFPSIYGATHSIFSEISRRTPGFSPKTMLDFGTGPGTAICSATDVFGNQFQEIRAVEPSQPMMNTAMKLLEGTNNVIFRKFLNEREPAKFDLVISSYMMSELDSPQSGQNLLRSLWNQTNEFFIIVEPGTPIGFQNILYVRDLILSLGKEDADYDAKIIAPCPHSGACPMATNSNTWCHFVQRSERIRVQREMKQNATRMYEDEKYSFIVFRKVPKGAKALEIQKEKEAREAEELEKKEKQARAESEDGFDSEDRIGDAIRRIALGLRPPTIEAGASDLMHFRAQARKILQQKEEEDEQSLKNKKKGGKGAFKIMKKEQTEEEAKEAEATEEETMFDREKKAWAEEFAVEAPHWDRLVRQPMIRKRHVILDMCSAQSGAIERLIVTKGKNRDAGYKFARKAIWGDLFPYSAFTGPGRERK